MSENLKYDKISSKNHLDFNVRNFEMWYTRNNYGEGSVFINKETLEIEILRIDESRDENYIGAKEQAIKLLDFFKVNDIDYFVLEI